MIIVFTVLIMLICAWSQYRNGLFTSVALLAAVFIAGLVAFGFFEPIADLIEPAFQNGLLAGSEDMIALAALFSIPLLALRVALKYLNPDMIDEHGHLQHFGAMAVGAIMGYFIAGFLICTMETLPLDENFLGFQPRAANEPGYRSVFPPDRVWLALMRHAGAGSFAWHERKLGPDEPEKDLERVDRYITFDRQGTFELRYGRYRRTRDDRGPMQYMGEFDIGLKDEKPN